MPLHFSANETDLCVCVAAAPLTDADLTAPVEPPSPQHLRVLVDLDQIASVRISVARNPLRWQLIANGHLDQLAYERGQIDTSLPFEEVRARSYITPVARGLAPGDDYSRSIRQGLPGPRVD